MKHEKKISRRTFLKGLGLGGASLALPSGAGALGRVDDDSELATLLDLSKCIGCGACVEACREANAHKFPEPDKPFPRMYPSRVQVADWSDKRDVRDRLTPYNWLFIQTAVVAHEGTTHEINIPRRCLHCQNPPCANLCPWGAALKQDDGVVRINTDICLGGAKCKTVCPWSIPQRQTGVGLYRDILPNYAGNGVMFKCDRCYDRLAKGALPACIEACPFEVQSIGSRTEMLQRARLLAAEMNGYLYGAEENGGTNTIYVSPVPFDVLNAGIETGPGRPHVNKVKDVMADEELLGLALMTAPLAGIAAGLLKAAGWAGRKLGRSNKEHRE